MSAAPQSTMTSGGGVALAEARALVHQPTICPTCRHREDRIAARERRDRRARGRWLVRFVWTAVIVSVLVLMWFRVGVDPLSAVQP